MSENELANVLKFWGCVFLIALLGGGVAVAIRSNRQATVIEHNDVLENLEGSTAEFKLAVLDALADDFLSHAEYRSLRDMWHVDKRTEQRQEMKAMLADVYASCPACGQKLHKEDTHAKDHQSKASAAPRVFE